MSSPLDLDGAEVAFAASTDATVGIEEEFAILDPETRELVPRFEELRDEAQDDALHARYLERIPVIALDGRELYDFVVDTADLSLRLRTVESTER